MTDCDCPDPYECECRDPLDDNPDVAELLRYNEPPPPPPVPIEPWVADMLRSHVRLIAKCWALSEAYFRGHGAAVVIDPYRTEPGVPEDEAAK